MQIVGEGVVVYEDGRQVATHAQRPPVEVCFDVQHLDEGTPVCVDMRGMRVWKTAEEGDDGE